MLAQTKPAPVCGWGAGLGVWILGSGGPALERKLSCLPSWMTLDNLFLSLSCVLCKRGIVLRIHGIAVHLRAATGHGRFSLSEAVWGSDPVGAGAAHSALVEPHQTLIFLLWDFSTYFVPPPIFFAGILSPDGCPLSSFKSLFKCHRLREIFPGLASAVALSKALF